MIKNFAILAAALLGGCASLGGALSCQGDKPGLLPGYQGVVEYQEVRVGFEFPGRVRQVTAIEGARVAAGDKLATLDDTLEQTARGLRQDEAAAAQAQVDLVKVGPRPEEIGALSARLRAAEAVIAQLAGNLERESALWKEGLSPKSAVDDLTNQLNRANAERDAIGQDLSRVRKGARKQEISGVAALASASAANVKIADERLARYSLIAPLAGEVLERHVEPGEVVAAGTPVVTLADTGHPFADVFVPEGSVANVKVGLVAQVRVDSLSTPLSGVVELVSRRTEFTPRYLFSERERPNLVVRVRVRIEDPEKQLRAGVPAFVTWAGAAAPASGTANGATAASSVGAH